MAEVYKGGRALLSVVLNSADPDMTLNASAASAGFPASGDFTVRVDPPGATHNTDLGEFIRINGVTGSVLSIASRGADSSVVQSTYAVGSIVTEVQTKQTFEILKKSTQVAYGVYPGELPSSPNLNKMFRASNSDCEFVYNGTVWERFFRRRICTNPPTTWTAVGGNITATPRADGAMIVETSSNSGDNTQYYRSAASVLSGNYTLIIDISNSLMSLKDTMLPSGVVIRNSGDSKLVMFGTYNTANIGFYVCRMNNDTSFASQWTSQPRLGSGQDRLVLKIVRDSTNRTYFASYDGFSFFQLMQESNTNHISGEDQIGYGSIYRLDVGAGAGRAKFLVQSLEVS